MDVTQLQFTDTKTTFTADSQTLALHNVQVTITGHLINETDVSDTKTEALVIRNYTLDD